MWIGALCVVIVERRLTTYFFIVRWLIGYGALSLYLLACLGLFLDQFQTCSLVGGIGWGSIRLKFGTESHCASFGVFGRSGIRGLLRIWIVPVIRCLLLLVELFLIGLGCGDSRLVIPSLHFFAPFLFCNFSIVWFSFLFFSVFLFLYFLGLLYVLHAQSSLSYIYHSYLSKKKEKRKKRKKLSPKILSSPTFLFLPCNKKGSILNFWSYIVCALLFFLYHSLLFI